MIGNILAGVYSPSVVLGDYESIQTVTVGSGGASSISFTSIPSTFQHLQVRVLAQQTRATFGRGGYTLRFNSDTGSNYATHEVGGDGSSPIVSAASSSTSIFLGYLGTTTAGYFGGTVIDVLDYANTNKNKTVRSLGGIDHNGLISSFGGIVGLNSGLWMNTSAINSITINPDFSPFTQHSSFALYGIKG
jgi:hypothetical protein